MSSIYSVRMAAWASPGTVKSPIYACNVGVTSWIAQTGQLATADYHVVAYQTKEHAVAERIWIRGQKGALEGVGIR